MSVRVVQIDVFIFTYNEQSTPSAVCGADGVNPSECHNRIIVLFVFERLTTFDSTDFVVELYNDNDQKNTFYRVEKNNQHIFRCL